ncbi:MAG: acetyl-CoA carboxylase biotin carboxyl carrier protein subunit [Porticoccaceae bacterium]|nr:acetyl-CoA carboxylase biotin carboxyl carrier protein subunit [Porticoccaceae bacterium]|tara:strand:+ start:14805 stop:15029 length:225 start_codon:yes stop_codon:yes gene_type:complete
MRLHLKSHVAGQVWKVVTQVGDDILTDQVVLIVDCMKMEIPIVSTKSGKLVEIRVSEKDLLAENQTVAVLETGQ